MKSITSMTPNEALEYIEGCAEVGGMPQEERATQAAEIVRARLRAQEAEIARLRAALTTALDEWESWEQARHGNWPVEQIEKLRELLKVPE